ncbi:MAG TPA: hypothetical protein PKD16_07395 [Saprospiraceae bacterium]|jgi:hypothetical protein|nr:hypothetical protein [Saprospiraceae bacterium]MBK8886035.1 hypothetical protein [Saprospiraceae bacterium]MBK9584018.1 hypothetical protein [Saprospiraceae bacterium]MBK9741774.1 hypothetical protein [Saprospiraceae bacterium]HMT69969.1 hypothetical protein [Saprospiraceae bacterium]
MALIHKIIIFLAVVLLASCKDNRQTIEKGIASISEIQCRAVRLNDRRFELFEQIRLLEADTIANKKAIDSLNTEAALIKKQSLESADTLRIKLADFLSSQKFSSEDRKYFDDQINALVAKCKSKK